MTKRGVVEQFNYPADAVWAYAVAAYRINGGYSKSSAWDYDSEGRLIQTQTPNREMVLAMLTASSVPNSEYLAAGREYRAYWQSQLLRLLDNSVNDYIKSVVTVAEKDIIETALDLSIVVSCIASTDKSKKQQMLNERKLETNSGWRYSVGSKVEFRNNIQVIRCQYLDKVGAYIVESIIDGDLYSWWSKQDIAVQTYKSLQARVKKTDVDYATKVPVTHLNYVKVN